MSSQALNPGEPRKDSATLAAGVAGAIASVFCSGGGLVVAGLGLGALAALLVDPWFLLPLVLISVGFVYWRANRTAACDTKPPVWGDRSRMASKYRLRHGPWPIATPQPTILQAPI